jgi:hypothetical protein
MKPATMIHPPPQRASMDQLLLHIADRIRHADRTLRHLEDEMDRHQGHPLRSHQLTAENKAWLARRRALVDVWEFASNQVWGSLLS